MLFRSSPKGFTGRPEAENLVNIYAGLTDALPEAVLAKFAGAQFSTFKQDLADVAVAKLRPIADEMRRLLNDPSAIDAVLKSGAERARAIAEPVMKDVKKLVGFVG